MWEPTQPGIMVPPPPSPRKVKNKKPTGAHEEIRADRPHCDACGRSWDLIGLAHAKFVALTNTGSLYFCHHHFRRYFYSIHEHGYETREL